MVVVGVAVVVIVLVEAVATNRSWSMKGLSGVEKREKEGALFTLLFETGRR